MKLVPRERKQRADYLLENAASLRLGHLFLGWNSKRSKNPRKTRTGASLSGKSKTTTKVCNSTEPIPTPPLPEPTTTLQLTICFVNGETSSLTIEVSSSVSELKNSIRKICDLPDEPVLFCNGKILAPAEQLLGRLGVENGSIVHSFSG